jgi:hypothetical protein
MKKLIEHLKKRPAHVRDQIAIFSALGVAGLVTVFWLASISFDYSSAETKTSFKESFSPFKLFGASVRSALDRSKEELATIDPTNPKSTEQNGEAAAVTVDERGVVNLGDQTEDTNEQ